MQQYEILCVLPGTLAETEVEPVAESIRTVVTERGGKIGMFQDLGKSRLSYPMRHIRYGYFRLCRFEAEQKDVKDIARRLGMMKELLRVFLSKLSPRNVGMNSIQFVATQPSTDRAEAFTSSLSAENAGEASAPKEFTAPSVSSPVERQDGKRVTLEDMTQKLDEILEKDIASQL